MTQSMQLCIINMIMYYFPMLHRSSGTSSINTAPENTRIGLFVPHIFSVHRGHALHIFGLLSVIIRYLHYTQLKWHQFPDAYVCSFKIHFNTSPQRIENL